MYHHRRRCWYCHGDNRLLPPFRSWSYYKSNHDVQNDPELQAFANEVSAEGKLPPDGGDGKVWTLIPILHFPHTPLIPIPLLTPYPSYPHTPLTPYPPFPLAPIPHFATRSDAISVCMWLLLMCWLTLSLPSLKSTLSQPALKRNV